MPGEHLRMFRDTLCGLDCACDRLPDGKRLCVLAEPPSVRDAHRDAQPGGADVGRYTGTYTVVARVSHRDNHGVDKPQTIYGPYGLSYEAACRVAVEMGTLGTFNDLMYYPPGRVLTVRLSPDVN